MNITVTVKRHLEKLLERKHKALAKLEVEIEHIRSLLEGVK